MKKNLLTAILSALTFVIFSCSDSGSSNEKIPLEIVMDGTYAAIDAKKEVLITGNEEYQALMIEVYKNLDQMPRIPVVDFTKNSLVAVFLGSKPSGGYFAGIDNIMESSKTLEVNVTETTPGKNCMVSDVLTAPYVIVKIPKTEKKAVYKYKTIAKDCN